MASSPITPKQKQKQTPQKKNALLLFTQFKTRLDNLMNCESSGSSNVDKTLLGDIPKDELQINSSSLNVLSFMLGLYKEPTALTTMNEAIAEDVPDVAASMKRRQQARQERGWSHAEDSRQQQYGQLLIDEHLRALEAELWALPQMGQVMRASKL